MLSSKSSLATSESELRADRDHVANPLRYIVALPAVRSALIPSKPNLTISYERVELEVMLEIHDSGRCVQMER